MWSLRGQDPGDQTSLRYALLFQYGHLWYLQSLLLLFTAISVADAFLQPSSVGLVLTGLAAIMISQSGVTVTTFFGIAGAFYLAPYFLFGIILRGEPDWLRNPTSGLLAGGIVVLILAAQQLGIFGLANEVTVLQLPAAIAGMAGVVFLLQRFPKNALLTRIGYYSYTIYLWHVMASAAMRGKLVHAGVTSIPILFLFSLTAGVVTPIIMYRAARRVPLLSVAVTGERWLRPVGRPPLFGETANAAAS